MRRAALLVLGLGPMPWAAGIALAEPARWGLAGGVALVSGYYSGASSGFPETLYPHLAIQRSVNRTLWLRSEVG